MPLTSDTPLPIDAVLDELTRTLADHNAAVLVAPPGAGKTTRVPLALLDAPWLKGKKIIMLEPRRIAARASAERMAKTLGERAGETVGYRVRSLERVGFGPLTLGGLAPGTYRRLSEAEIDALSQAGARGRRERNGPAGAGNRAAADRRRSSVRSAGC